MIGKMGKMGGSDKKLAPPDAVSNQPLLCTQDKSPRWLWKFPVTPMNRKLIITRVNSQGPT